MKPKDQKRYEGDVRNDVWRSLSREEKIASLDRRLGKGQGASRQRKLLSKEAK